MVLALTLTGCASPPNTAPATTFAQGSYRLQPPQAPVSIIPPAVLARSNTQLLPLPTTALHAQHGIRHHHAPSDRDTSVQLQWSNTRSRGLVTEWGGVGMQLQGGSRVVLRARSGGPMIYYRSRF